MLSPAAPAIFHVVLAPEAQYIATDKHEFDLVPTVVEPLADGWYRVGARTAAQRADLPGAGLEFEVPIVMWYEPFLVRVAAIGRNHHRWKATCRDLLLDPRVFERAPLPSCWTRPPGDGTAVARCSKPPAEIAKETWQVADDIYAVQYGGDDMRVTLVVARTTQPDGAPLTFYVDRVWDLVQILIDMPAAVYKELY